MSTVSPWTAALAFDPLLPLPSPVLASLPFDLSLLFPLDFDSEPGSAGRVDFGIGWRCTGERRFLRKRHVGRVPGLKRVCPVGCCGVLLVDGARGRVFAMYVRDRERDRGRGGVCDGEGRIGEGGERTGDDGVEARGGPWIDTGLEIVCHVDGAGDDGRVGEGKGGWVMNRVAVEGRGEEGADADVGCSAAARGGIVGSECSTAPSWLVLREEGRERERVGGAGLSTPRRNDRRLVRVCRDGGVGVAGSVGERGRDVEGVGGRRSCSCVRQLQRAGLENGRGRRGMSMIPLSSCSTPAWMDVELSVCIGKCAGDGCDDEDEGVGAADARARALAVVDCDSGAEANQALTPFIMRERARGIGG